MMGLIRVALGKPSYDGWKKVPVTTQGWDDHYPVYSIPGLFPYSAWLLGGHARLTVSQGQTDEACANIWEMMVLADLLAEEPMPIVQMERWAVWSMALKELEQVAASAPLPPAWDQKFSSRLAGLDLVNGLAREFDGSRVEDVAGQILSARLR
jgi:hypothetical protein